MSQIFRNEPSWHVDIAPVPPIPIQSRFGKTYPLKFKPFMAGPMAHHRVEVERAPGGPRADFAGLQPRITYTVEPAGEAERFTRAVEMKPGGLKMLMTPMMALMVPRRNKVFVQNQTRTRILSFHPPAPAST
jgi:hypothetical protein